MGAVTASTPAASEERRGGSRRLHSSKLSALCLVVLSSQQEHCTSEVYIFIFGEESFLCKKTDGNMASVPAHEHAAMSAATSHPPQGQQKRPRKSMMLVKVFVQSETDNTKHAAARAHDQPAHAATTISVERPPILVLAALSKPIGHIAR